jgi:hypothetical protein
MKLPAVYQENALAFEQPASREAKPELKVACERQAVAYRRLAAGRAKRLGLSDPPRASDRHQSASRTLIHFGRGARTRLSLLEQLQGAINSIAQMPCSERATS